MHLHNSRTKTISEIAHALLVGRPLSSVEAFVTAGPVSLDRSRFRRVRAPMLVRPVGLFARSIPRNVDETKVGGLRAYSDDPQRLGRHLELEILLPGRGSVTLVVEVAWIEKLGVESQARFDVGLRYVNASPEDLDRLATVLGD